MLTVDLAVALAVLAAAEFLEAPRAAGVVHLGELGLDGRLRPVRGVLPAVAAAVAAGHPDVVVPEADAPEAALVPGARVVGFRSLAQVVQRYGGAVAVPDVPVAPPVRASGAHCAPRLGGGFGRYSPARVAGRPHDGRRSRGR